jgi:nicotinamidase/pyrazinamidase
LKKLGIERLGVSGIATEYCVRATAVDAIQAGFKTVVLTDLIRAVKASETPRVLAELCKAGATAATAAEWLKSLEETQTSTASE